MLYHFSEIDILLHGTFFFFLRHPVCACGLKKMTFSMRQMIRCNHGISCENISMVTGGKCQDVFYPQRMSFTYFFCFVSSKHVAFIRVHKERVLSTTCLPFESNLQCQLGTQTTNPVNRFPVTSPAMIIAITKRKKSSEIRIGKQRTALSQSQLVKFTLISIYKLWCKELWDYRF